MHTVTSVLVSLCVSSAAFAQSPVQVVVGFKDAVDLPALARQGVEPVRTIGALRAAVVQVTAKQVAALRRLPEVAYVELDHVASATQRGRPGGGGGGGGGGQVTPAGITRVGGAVATTGARVAIVDTGIDLDHPDLAASIVGDSNFVRSGYPGDDDNGHGTHCAGTVGALDNSIDVVGVAPGAELLAAKALDRRGSGSYSAIAAAIIWSADNGANVISMSLTGPVSQTVLADACNYADNTALLVGAAGNDGDCNLTTDEIGYPAYYGNVVSVGATSTETMDALMCFSNSNGDVELSAPGHNVLSTKRGGGTTTMSGTSMACPHVAGCAAVLIGGGMSPAQAIATLRSYADDAGPVGRDNGWGIGICEHVNND